MGIRSISGRNVSGDLLPPSPPAEKATAHCTRLSPRYTITELVKADLRPKYGQWGEFDNWMMMNVDRILLEQRLGY
jgi:hypothetical protein